MERFYVKELKPFLNTNIKVETLEADVFEWAGYGSQDHFDEMGEEAEVFKIIDGNYYINKKQKIVEDILYRLEEQVIDMHFADYEKENEKYARAANRVVKKLKEVK